LCYAALPIIVAVLHTSIAERAYPPFFHFVGRIRSYSFGPTRRLSVPKTGSCNNGGADRREQAVI
jgi:hypothetical protein